MKVILLQDVPGTGKKNQIVNVSDGYARNYLFPRQWAKEASDTAVREIEKRNEKERLKELERLKAAQELAQLIQGKTIELKAKCGEKGRLYGSVTPQEVADALSAQLQLDIDKRKVELPEPIRNLGESTAILSIYAGVKAQVKLHIVPLNETK